MANRKFLIENILGLAQKLGANPNKFIGTKSNINFLGTGDKGMKGTTFSGQLNEDFLDLGFGKSDMIKIIEQDAGYVTAGKLNDVQLNTMFNNLKMIDETFNPPPLPPGPMNVIDLETRTRNLNKEGLMSLRQSDDVGGEFVENTTGSVMVPDKRGPGFAGMEYKTKEGIETLKTKSPFRGSGKAADEVQDIVDQKFGKGYFDDVAGDIERVEKQAAENNFIKSGAADFTDFVSAEGGRRAVVRQVMKNNANYFGLTPEVAESIAKSKDLGKGGSNFPDPLIVFRDKGNFTRQELEQIDEIIESTPFSRVEDIANKVSDYVQSIRPDGFAEGGRIGFKSGKSVKDGIAALLKLGNKKFGKDTIKVADDIEPSEFSKFNERNKVLDDLDIEDYTDELGDPETWYTFGMTVREADELVKSRKAYEAQMFTDYKAGRLDPKPGESGRKKFLEKRAEEAEMSGDPRLFTLDEADELASMQKYGGPKTDDYYMKNLKTSDSINVDELPIELLDAEAIMVKYPGITERLARLIGNDTNLQRKAEALSAIDQAMALRGAGKSADETIEILKREPKTKMKKGGLAQILEM